MKVYNFGKIKFIWNYSDKIKLKFIAVNFSKDTIDENQKTLNDAFTKGYRVSQIFEREHAVVYELYLEDEKIKC